MIIRHFESLLFAVAAAAFFALSTSVLAFPLDVSHSSHARPLAGGAQLERFTRQGSFRACRSCAVFVTQAIQLAARVRAPARPSPTPPDREKA